MPNELAPGAGRWTSRQTREQFAAIAWLRWRILLNGLRRKGGTGELVARMLVYPMFAGILVGPTLLAGFGAYWFASIHHFDRIAWLLWATFVLCQMLNIQVGQPNTTFDPTQLIRFPVRLGSYTAIRLFFGLLTPANVIAVMMSLAVAFGITLAVPSLWLVALVALVVFASANVLFSRMVFAWVDRWLATRRAREIFTALIFAFSLGVQWLNFSYNPAYNHHHHTGHVAQHLTSVGSLYERALPFLHWLPPELTASSLIAAQRGRPGSFLGLTFACALFSALFFAVFALRMRTEFRGENLSDAANAVARSAGRRVAKVSETVSGPRSAATRELALAPAGRSLFRLSPVVAAVLGKEVLYVRRNTGVFYSLIAPVVLVFLLAGRLAARGSSMWVFPVALLYTMFGIMPLSYNSFGLEGTGAQFYFLAPVRMRDVFLAKNLVNFSLALLEAAAVFCIVSYVSSRPSLQTAAVALLWAAATLLLNTALGNRRSISAPKQVKTARAAGKQASPLSAFLGMGVLLLSAAIASMLVGAALYFQQQWVLLPAFGLFFATALAVYLHSLGSLDRYALEHREELFTELCKKS